jgi:hypothetical protein
MKVVGYVRLPKAEEGHGLSVQRRAIEDYCQRRGYELAEIHEDNGASGRSTRKRPGLAAAIEACSRRDVGGIVATRVDRLARSSLDFHPQRDRPGSAVSGDALAPLSLPDIGNEGRSFSLIVCGGAVRADQSQYADRRRRLVRRRSVSTGYQGLSKVWQM